MIGNHRDKRTVLFSDLVSYEKVPFFQEKCLSLHPEQEYYIFLTCERPRVERYSKLLCGYIGFGRPAGTALEFVF